MPITMLAIQVPCPLAISKATQVSTQHRNSELLFFLSFFKTRWSLSSHHLHVLRWTGWVLHWWPLVSRHGWHIIVAPLQQIPHCSSPQPPLPLEGGVRGTPAKTREVMQSPQNHFEAFKVTLNPCALTRFPHTPHGSTPHGLTWHPRLSRACRTRVG